LEAAGWSGSLVHEKANEVAGGADTAVVGIAFHVGKRAARERGDFIHKVFKVHAIHAKVIENAVSVAHGEPSAPNPDAEPFENSPDDDGVSGPAIKRPREPTDGFSAPCRREGTDWPSGIL
jgi:hypothetical protein